MKLSYQWLKDYVDYDLTPAELAHQLTMLGLEVEAIEKEGEDTVLELSVTPNRGDCLSYIGIAREIAMLTDSELRLPMEGSPALNTHPLASQSWEVNIEDPGLCPRYSACIIKGVKIAPSPNWLVERLEHAGIRALNNIVDITNYILLEWGQPLHAFDLNLISGNKIIIRKAKHREPFTTLDGKEYELDDKMLVISDREKAVALGGVMGGLNSEVTPETQDILLECAYFNPIPIRYTSRKLGITTESSYRFERGTDGSNLLNPLKHAINLIQKLAGGTPQEPIIDSYPVPLPQPEIFLRFERVNQILGTNLTPQEIKKLIKRMFFNITDERVNGINVQILSARQEISREIDLIEEIARLYGYEDIPTTTPKGILPGQAPDHSRSKMDNIRYFLTSCGLFEAINFSFTSRAFCSKLKSDAGELNLDNPLNQDTGTLRTTLLPGLLQNILHNLNHQVLDIKLFEVGHCFWSAKGKLPNERNFLAIALTGKRNKTSWDVSPEAIDFFDLKGIIESLLEYLGLSNWQWERNEAVYLHPGQSARLIINGTIIGSGGKLHPEKEKEFDLQQPVFLWEMDMELLLQYLPKAEKVVSLPKYPATFRDLAVVVDHSVAADQVKEVITETAGKFLKDIQLFDVYSGKQVAKGKKSLAFSLTYQSDESTFEEERINLLQEEIIQTLRQKLGAELR